MPMIKCILTEQNKGGNGAIILNDEMTSAKYNLIVENGFLSLQEIREDVDSTDIQLIDIATGVLYKLVVENSILKLEEV